MRLWSIHPKYLDLKGLVALWRETLLAKKVLQNETKGYKNHPQLERFKNQTWPLEHMNIFLNEIYKEAKKRDYNFDQNKIGELSECSKVPVTTGQITYEFKHLLEKLKERDSMRYNKYKEITKIDINPAFKKVSGSIEKWEKIKHL